MYKKIRSSHKKVNESGVTLVELMITVAISGFVIAAIYMSYKTQQRAAIVQNQVAEMQQILRGTLTVMGSELRMAGYNPNDTLSMTNIKDANSTKITFQYWDAEGDEIDTVSYKYDKAHATLDRKIGGGPYQAISEHIDNVEFYYTLDDSTKTLTPSPFTDIRRVAISILARSRSSESDYTDTKTYTTASGAIFKPPPDDGFRRKQQITTVQFRNMGL